VATVIRSMGELFGHLHYRSCQRLHASYVERYKALFGKVARDSHDAHRPVRPDGDLDSIFARREQRKVISNLTLHFERKLYLLADTPSKQRYAGKYLDVYQFPDGKIEIRAAGVKTPYSTYDELGAIDQGAIVENKRLGHAVRISEFRLISQTLRLGG
jgi:hypothetical protein